MILTLVLKNFKIILRSPFTMIFLILSPILLMYIVGISYSNSSISDIKLGIVSNNNSFFKDLNKNLKIKYYPSNNLVSCVNDLKNTKIDLCIKLDLLKDENNQIKSANLNYYIDNTRAQMSEIVIKYVNSFVDLKTKQISTNTINTIFSEIKNTIDFMNSSQKDLINLKNNVTYIRKNMEDFYVLFKISKNNFNLNYNLMQNQVKNLNLNQLTKNENKLNSNLNSISNNIKNAKVLLNNINFQSKSLYNSIYYYSNYVNPNISNYVNLTEIIQMDNNIKELSTLLDKIDFSISNVNTVSYSQSLNNSLTHFNKLLSSISDLNSNLDNADSQISNLISQLKEKERYLDDLNNQMNTKINYFNQLANKDPSQISEPITKKSNYLFKNFKMVHRLAPTIVILMLLFIGLLLSNVIVSMEVNSKAYFRNLISPVSQLYYVVALFLTSFFIIFFQMIFLLFILYIYFGISNITHEFLILTLVISHLLVVFILLGLFLAYMFISMQMSILVTTFLMLFMLLVSSAIVPIELMSSSLAFFINLNPVVIGIELIRRVFYFPNSNINFIDFLVLYFYMFILLLLIKFAVSRRKSKMF